MLLSVRPLMMYAENAQGLSAALDCQILTSDHALTMVEDCLTHRLVLAGNLDVPPVLHEAIQAAVMQGGKRLRPCLMLQIAQVLGADKHTLMEKVLPVACALELIHAYSLVHDDLPAMDNAPLRRGQPSCWKAHGESTAILVGDALIPLAFEWIADAPLSAPVICSLVKKLSEASGGRGMVGGQFMDMAPDKARIYDMQRLKTGALLGFACEAPAVMMQLADEQRTSLRTFGQTLGVMYQVVDDLLDHAATADQLGKPAQNDGSKITFITTLGLEGAQDFLMRLVTELMAITAPLPINLQVFLKERTATLHRRQF